MAYLDSRSRPPRKVSSMMNAQPTTSPPSDSTSPAIASTVPPVASTSSWISTRAPWPIISGCSSSAFWPYSSAYVALTVSGGSLPGRRAATNPQPISCAIAAPRMKPRASAPRTRWGSFVFAHAPSSSIVCRSASGSARSGMMSRKTTPFCGKSGTSRTLVLRSTAMSGRDELPQLEPEEELRQLLRELGEVLEVLHPRLPPLRVAGAQRRRDDGFQQARLASRRGAEGAQVARRDAELREPRAGDRDIDVTLAVEPLALVRVGLQEPVVLELAGKLAADPGAPAEFPEIEVLLPAEPERPRPLAVLPAGGRGELLPDHPQRQELVALEPQDRLQPVDVLLAEEPVAALRAPQGEEALVLEVADLRDRDVGKLPLEARADGADREQAGRGRGFGHAHIRRNMSRYLPIWSSSPSFSSADSIRWRLRKVPFRLPKSSMTNLPSRCVSTACLRETVTSSRKISQSGERPIVVRSPSGWKVSPALPPPERTTSAGPLTPRSSRTSAGSSPSPSSGRYAIVVSAPLSWTRSAPHLAQ